MYKYILIVFSLILSPAFADTPADKQIEKFESSHPILKKHKADTTTEAFLRLPQKEQIQVLQKVIDKYRKEGVEVKLEAFEYLDVIDGVLAKDPEYIGIPLSQIFRQILIEEGSLAREE